MADNKNMNHNQTPNQTMQNEQAKSSVGGNDRKTEQGQFDKDRKSETGNLGEKSAIGGGDTRSQTGEPGRARNELDDNKSRTETTGNR